MALLWMGRIMGIQTSLGGRVEAFLGHVEKLLWSGGQQSLGSGGCCRGWVGLPVCSLADEDTSALRQLTIQSAPCPPGQHQNTRNCVAGHMSGRAPVPEVTGFTLQAADES